MTATAPPKPALFTRPFVLVALANLSLNVASSFALHLPGFLQELGAREAEIGRIMGVHALAALGIGPLVGHFMDRRGRCIVIRAGALLFVFAASLYLAIDRLSPFVYVVRVIDGISATLLYASLFTFAADVVPESRRTEGLGLFGASGLVPLGLGGVAGDIILASMTYRTLFAVALGFGVVGLFTALPLRDVAQPVLVKPRSAARSAWSALAARQLVPIWLAAFAFFFAMSALLAFLKTYVLATGLGSVGTFFMIYAGIALLLRVFVGWLPDRVGLRRMVLPALGCYALGAVTLAFATSAWQVLLAALLCGIGHSYGYPVLFSLVVARARPEERGAAMTTYTCVDWAGYLVSGPLIGFIIERAGYPTAFIALAALLAAHVTAFYGLDRAKA
jgi:MFS family permease